MSIVQVAKRAGVSHTTVSRLLNGKTNIKADTADKIRKAMNELGYVPRPPQARRGPKRSINKGFKFFNVALLMKDNVYDLVPQSPITLELLRGVEIGLSERGVNMIHAGSGKQLPPAILQGNIDGVIVFSDLSGLTTEIKEVLMRHKLVYIMSGQEEVIGDRVFCSSRNIGKIAAEYLVKRGHKELVFFDVKSPDSSGSSWPIRWEAFLETCRINSINATKIEIDITPGEILSNFGMHKDAIIEASKIVYSFRQGKKSLGIFVTIDSLTAVLYPYLQNMGLQIGNNIDIISCNNEAPFLAGLHPRPATIDIQARQIGRKAVERLEYRLLNPEDDSQVIIKVNPRIVEGEL